MKYLRSSQTSVVVSLTYFLLSCSCLLSCSATTFRSGVRIGGRPDFGRNADASEVHKGKGSKDDHFTFPGLPRDAGFQSHGGYVTVDEAAGRELYYVYIEAEADANDEAPVVLWLNGGPGCSSLGGGLMSELGPIYPTRDGERLTVNRHRWNRVAHMVFLESPAFVGFSTSATPGDRVVGDARTAADALAFLLGFFERFPALRARPFWVSGESYGGHYVPNLALAVHRHNAALQGRGGGGAINLQGFLVGNAWTDAATDNEGAVDFWWSHAIVSDEARNGMKQHCDFARIGPLSQAPGCDAAVKLGMANMGAINIYDIFADVCLASRARLPALALGRHLSEASAGVGVAARVAALQELSGKYDACIDDEVQVYLNRPEVQHAMHANTTGNVAGPWQDCSPLVDYSREDLLSSMLPVYRELLKADLKMLVFSGDVDAIVPVVGTRRWIAKLDLEVKEPWRPWVTRSGQVGGYVEVYDGLTFATVREAGHMVPYTQPERAFHMFERFVTGVAL